MSTFVDKLREPELSLKKDAGMAPDGSVTTEFSMWLLDSVTINHLATTVTSSSFQLALGNTHEVFPFFYAMREMWSRIRVVCRETKTIDDKIKEIGVKIRNLESSKNAATGLNIPIALLDELQNLKNMLLQRKQDIGLGIPWNQKWTDKQRIKNALR